MTTEQTAKQLRLAADILETGHPWEWKRSKSTEWVKARAYHDPINRLVNGNEIHLVLATPPDGKVLHNPDKLTAEQVGAGWRLTVDGEAPHHEAQIWNAATQWQQRGIFICCDYTQANTYRLPISTPWPEAEKPDTPSFTLPPPPPGMKWYREDGWTAEMLPQGYRPLVGGEIIETGDETPAPGPSDSAWQKGNASLGKSVNASNYWFWRTTRPLTFEHEGKTWTWHRPGDPMPCDGDKEVNFVMKVDWWTCATIKSPAWKLRWTALNPDSDIIGWRYAEPETKTVELGPEDVPPGSFIRQKITPHTWEAIGYLGELGIFDYERRLLKWHTLSESYQINRSLPLTGKWNPDAWGPCHKQIANETP